MHKPQLRIEFFLYFCLPFLQVQAFHIFANGNLTHTIKLDGKLNINAFNVGKLYTF